MNTPPPPFRGGRGPPQRSMRPGARRPGGFGGGRRGPPSNGMRMGAPGRSAFSVPPPPGSGGGLPPPPPATGGHGFAPPPPPGSGGGSQFSPPPPGPSSGPRGSYSGPPPPATGPPTGRSSPVPPPPSSSGGTSSFPPPAPFSGPPSAAGPPPPASHGMSRMSGSSPQFASSPPSPPQQQQQQQQQQDESPPVPVESRPWFRPELSVGETAKWLKAKTAGAFVVRPSSQGANCLALSYMDRNGVLEHALIYRSSKRGFCLESQTGVWHVTLDGLLRSLALEPHGTGEGGDMLSAAVPVPPPSQAAAAAAANLAARVASASPPAGGGGGAAAGRAPSSPSAGTKAEAQAVIDELRSAAAAGIKKAVFQLRDKLLDDDFSRAFLDQGGLAELRALINSDTSGNTLAYALEALRRLWRYHSPTEDEPGGVLDSTTLAAIVARLDEAASSSAAGSASAGGGSAGNLNVVKSGLELIMLLNQRDKGLFAQAFGGGHQGSGGGPARFVTLVSLLGWSRADVDVQRKALTLLNAVLQNERDEERRAALYDELDQRGLFPALAPLRGARDPMLCTHLCAFQVQRFAGLGRRKRTAFDKQNPDHEGQLAQLWSLTFPDRPMERISSDWGLLGFQGKDPATDFRGMGMLGLDCLCYFAQHYTDRWRALIQRNIARGEREYPVAVGGINVCSAIDDFFNFSGDSTSSSAPAIAAASAAAAVAAAGGSQAAGVADDVPRVNSAMLHPLLLDHRNPFEEIHCCVLELLDKLWDAMNASYMQFQSVLEATRDQMQACMNGRYSSFAEWRAAIERDDPLPLPLPGSSPGGATGSGSSVASGSGSAANSPMLGSRKGTKGQKLQHLIKSARRSASDILTSHSAAGVAASPLSASSPAVGMSGGGHVIGGVHIAVPPPQVIPLSDMKLSSAPLHETELTQVFAARWNGIDDVCVKRFVASDAGHSEWATELESLIRVQHPHVVQLLGVMTSDEADHKMPALVCALAEGGNLADALYDDGANYDVVQRVHLLLGIARGIAALHSRGLVHGALSAHHVLVDDGCWRPRLCSLGEHQKRVTSKGTPSLGPQGTAGLAEWASDARWLVDPAYAAPEQFSKPSAESPAADAFSLGVLAWAVAQWQVPWDNDPINSDPVAIVDAVLGQGQRLPLDGLTDERVGALAAIRPFVQQLWSPSPDNRPDPKLFIQRHLIPINDSLF